RTRSPAPTPSRASSRCASRGPAWAWPSRAAIPCPATGPCWPTPIARRSSTGSPAAPTTDDARGAPMKLAQAIAEQVDSNRSGVGHAADFDEHRARLTREIGARAPAGGGGRLCLLGAGNAHDVDLGQLAARFAE